MKVTLCTSPHLDRSPLFDGRERHGDRCTFAQTFVPMGLLSLAGSVANMNVTPRIFDINKQINAGVVALGPDLYTRAAELILADPPDVIGFMTDCDSFHHVLRICSAIRVRAPATVIVLGCVHASYNAPFILQRYPFIDYIVREEGEIAFRQLLEAIAGQRALASVGNLTYRDGGEVRASASLPLIPDLDTLPLPDMSLVSLQPQDSVWIEIGRGCPFRCNFCVTAPYWSRRHRIKSPQRILSELEFFRDEYGRRDFNFTHDLFTTDRRWVLKFCSALADASLGVTWTCSSRTDTLDEEQLAAMAKAGCRDIYFGVEAGTAGMQSAIDKGLSLTKARELIQLCHRYDVSTTMGFIAGLPGETSETLAGTLREATHYLGMNRTVVHLFGFGPYRGSTNFSRIEKDLIPEVQFIDFPLDEQTDTENRALILAHRDVFARYSRLADHRDTGFHTILEVAEEYFPLLNAVPHITAYLIEAGVEPYDQLYCWAQWLLRSRHAGQPRSYQAHLGSIDDFLDFSEALAKSRGLGSDRFAELLKWERLKQLFRSGAPGTRLSGNASDEGPSPPARLNPTVRLEQFRFPPGAENGSDDHSAKGFAFLRRRDGSAGIVRVGPVAMAIMKAANDSANNGSFPSTLHEIRISESIPEDQRTHVMGNTFEQLVASEVIFVS